MKSVLITGCNRGIGLGLIQQLVKSESPPKKIIATCRSREKSTELVELSDKNPNVHILEIDLKNLNSYPEFAKKVGNIVKDDGLNVLINNAGVSSKFTRIGLVKAEQMLENFLVNTIAPLMLTKSVLQFLKTASQKNDELPVSVSRAAIINISSILGSIQANDIGGFYPYRCSKSALNAMTKSLSLDLKDNKILVVSIHPGWCKTDLGGQNAPLTVETVVTTLLKTFKSLTDENNGTFIQYDGKSLSW